MIRQAHTHEDGKVCFQADSRFKHPRMVRIGGKELYFAYMQYTGQWYAFNVETGKEVATFSSEFYETYLKNLQVTHLIADPDCIIEPDIVTEN